ncbi:hypothetical protein OAR75_00455 [Candidatus Pelagibacter sp.]|nr:hypothetical protein [Candidatus Pelagibacter sp.]
MSDKSKFKDGDIDILDENYSIRKSFLSNKEFKKSITPYQKKFIYSHYHF